MAVDYIMVVGGVVRALKERDYLRLQELSNHTIHDASIFQDEHSLTLAVAVYSLSKILNRKGSISNKVISSLEKLKKNIQDQDSKACSKSLQQLVKLISEEDSMINIYITEVIDQAKIKKGQTLYEHGLSISKAADLLGISCWDLAGYVGRTVSCDVKPKVTQQKRMDWAWRLFR